VWGGAVAVRMLGAGVEARVAVVVSQVPRRTRLDEFTAHRAIHESGIDERCPRPTSAPVNRQPVLPIRSFLRVFEVTRSAYYAVCKADNAYLA
jgi:hypothetical protein